MASDYRCHLTELRVWSIPLFSLKVINVVTLIFTTLGGSAMAGECQVSGQNAAAQFALKLHRGDGMTLVAMNWKNGKPPKGFVGFAIECKEPDSDKFFP